MKKIGLFAAIFNFVRYQVDKPKAGQKKRVKNDARLRHDALSDLLLNMFPGQAR